MNTIETVKEILLQFGTIWVLWLLGALSILSVLIVVERLLFYRTLQGNIEAIAQGLDKHLQKDDFSKALSFLKQSPSVAARIAAAGLRLAHLGPKAAQKGIESATALEQSRMERWLAYLGTLGNNAPFVGLLGTVIGIVGAFEELSKGRGNATAAGQLASQALMSNIAEALIVTAIGILVALPAVAFYNYLQRKMTNILTSTEALSGLVLAYLQERPDTQNEEESVLPLENPEKKAPSSKMRASTQEGD